MGLLQIILIVIFLGLANTSTVKISEDFDNNTNIEIKDIDHSYTVFNGVYTECFLHLSYSCLQNKTLLYLKELNNLCEVSVIGDYVKFVKVNTTTFHNDEVFDPGNTDELAFLIDKAVDDFFDNHVLKFNALGRDISIPQNMEVFVGRKKHKGGGGGDMMGGHGHDDKKKLMMMAMMCMKMKLMMMVPAMMGMMGIMSFKGMIFSMLSFLISKLVLLLKILEKRGGVGGIGGSGGGGDGGWTAAGGGGGAWMPAGGQDFGGGGGYDANGQWQSRSIAETLDIMNKPTVYYKELTKPQSHYRPTRDDIKLVENNFDYQTVLESPDFKLMPEMSYVKPLVRFNNKIEKEVFKKPVLVYKKSNVDFSNFGKEINDRFERIENDVKSDVFRRAKRSLLKFQDRTLALNINKDKENINDNKSKPNYIARKKRSILDIIQNSYTYWMSTLLGLNNNRRTNFQKYKTINGVRYVYYPFKPQKPKTPKEVQLNSLILQDKLKPIITAEDFNRGEIVEGGIEAITHRKKFTKIKDTVNDTVDDNPWE